VRVLEATANPDGGAGLLLRGYEYEPILQSDLAPRSGRGQAGGGLQAGRGLHAAKAPRAGGGPLAASARQAAGKRQPVGGGGAAPGLDPFVVEALLRMARLAGSVGDALRDCPDASVRRSAAILAARAHPLTAALDG